MQFLSPIWFFALAALSIPIVIHLWNIKPGKTLKVGSISLISEASKTNRRSFKLVDILLFILRCLLLALLAFFLAAPVWQHLRSTEKVKGWVLLPKENLKESYQKFKPAIDSLTRAGYEFHYFESGFARGDLTKMLADTNHRDTASANNYWGLVKQLNNKVSSALPVYIFTPNGSTHFKGAKPAAGLNLHWQTYTTADSVSKWIAAAAFTADNTIKVIQGNGSPAGIYYTGQFVKNDGSPDIDVKVQNGQPVISFKNSEQTAVQVDTSTLQIAIYTDKYTLDAGYLKAALSAVVSFTGRKAIIRQYNNPAQIPGGQEWLFWLSDEPVSSGLLSSKNIFKYENGKAATTASWIDAGAALFNANKKIALSKLIASNGKNEPVWNDGFGMPVLDKTIQKNTNIYRFYSRFNPNWNDLVWSGDFPKVILKLINNNSYQQPEKFDKRILTNQQIQPIQIKQTTGVAPTNPAEQVDLSKYFWLLVVALFVAERTLSHKTKTIATNG